MINGAHVLLYSEKAELDRAFFKDVLGFPAVDVGHGWLIFGLPPAEVAVHPADDANADPQKSAQQMSEEKKPGAQQSGRRQIGAVLYLMCDDLAAQVAQLRAKGASCGEVHEERWGSVTTIRLPSGAELGLYQPKHAVAYGLKMG